MTIAPRKWGIILLVVGIILFGILAQVKVNIDERSTFLCKLVAADPALTMEECPAHKDSTSWLLLVAFGIVFLLLGSGFYLMFLPVEKTEKTATSATLAKDEVYRKPKKEVDLKQLSEEEQKLYALLTENKGSLYQSDLVSKTGFSKVQITRILDRMEGAGIIERKRRGMTNVVILQ
ncbi:MarR family transcriptional regulator [Candidatus Woesearchaeota archaeon]|nr:MarR family transcriptional regulator [Candidatus Woesearchaeota archaeon]